MEDVYNNNQYNQDLSDTSAFTSANNQNADDQTSIIMAIGVGGGGNNAVNHMFDNHIEGVSFVNINTDRQALRHSKVPTLLQIGDGLGAGNKPEKARDFAEESADKIAALFDGDTKMVFITAGMGGGTGTGAAPVVARIAKERGLLTIGIVTIPFLFEGQKKIKKAIAGADEMAKYVDALLVINNERLNEIYGDLNFINAFGKADDTLSIAARSISEIITTNGLMNLDFNDVDTTLRDGGAAIISTGYGEGENRVTKAIQDALKSPLLKNRDILGSKKLLFNLYFNPKAEEEFVMSETREITDFISSMSTEVDVIWGVSFDESLGNSVKMTILAAGFDVTLRDEELSLTSSGRSGNVGGGNTDSKAIPTPPPAPGETRSFGSDNVGIHQSQQTVSQQPTTTVAPPPKPVTPDPEEISTKRVIDEYGTSIAEGKNRTSTIILNQDQFDDDAICEILEKYPTYNRDRSIVDRVASGLTPDNAVGLRSSQSSSTGRTIAFG